VDVLFGFGAETELQGAELSGAVLTGAARARYSAEIESIFT
jgi:hypothetical protein